MTTYLEMPVTVFQSIQHYIPEYLNLHQYLHENPQSCIMISGSQKRRIVLERRVKTKTTLLLNQSGKIYIPYIHKLLGNSLYILHE